MVEVARIVSIYIPAVLSRALRSRFLQACSDGGLENESQSMELRVLGGDSLDTGSATGIIVMASGIPHRNMVPPISI